MFSKNFLPQTPEQIEAGKKNADAGWRAQFPSEKVFHDAFESEGDVPPAYRFKWDLAIDTNLTRRVMYMAELNPDQPAAMVMAGIIATQQRSYNLAAAAYQRAIDLGSPQSEVLKWHIEALNEHIRQSLAHRSSASALVWITGLLVGIPLLVIVAGRQFRKRTSVERGA